MPRISVDSGSIFSDPRWKRLARFAGLRFQDAWGSAMCAWAICYERRTAFLPARDIDDAADHEGFADAMVRAELADETPDGIRVRGVIDRIDYLLDQAERGKKGGEVKAERDRHARAVATAIANATPTQAALQKAGERHSQSAIGYSSPDTATAPDTVPEVSSDAPHLDFSTPADPGGGERKSAVADRPPVNGKGRAHKLAQEPPKPEPAPPAQTSLPAVATGQSAPLPAKRAEAGRRHPETQQAIDGFHAMYVAWSGGQKPSWKGPQIGMITDLMNTVGSAAEVLARARVMFDLAPKFPAEHPDLGTLCAHFDKFVVPPKGAANGAGPRVGQGRVATAEELGPSGDRRFGP